MPKIRGVKPDLWTDEDFVEVSPYARLLWIGMWNYACDNGHLQDKSKQIKMRVLPTDDVNCAELLRELADQGLIHRENGWITVPNLPHHQRPDKRYWQTCGKPGCDRPNGDSQPETRGAHNGRTTGAHRDHALPHVDGDVRGSDGDGDGEHSRGGKPPASRARQLPDDFRPSESHEKLAADAGVDLQAEWPQFVDHHRSKGSTMKDWDAALRTWIRNAKRFGSRPAPQPERRRHLVDARDLELPPDGLSPTEYAEWDRQQRAKRRQ